MPVTETRPAWTPEMDARLRQLVATRQSAAKIATIMSKDLGRELTRNAVVGRTYRLEMAFKAPQAGGRPRSGPYARVALKRRRRADAPDTITASDPLHLSLDELKYSSCRWPYGEGPYTFCGHRIEARGMSYCPYHERVAYRGSSGATGAPRENVATGGFQHSNSGGPMDGAVRLESGSETVQ